MLKLNYVNDLHLDFYAQFTTNPLKQQDRVNQFVDTLLANTAQKGNVLVVAGDFGHVNAVSALFLEAVTPHYDHVFATFGNHDLYLLSKKQASKFRKHSPNRVEELKTMTAHLDNLTWLVDDTVHEHQGVRFAGNPMFAMPESPQELLFYRQSMNDSQFVMFSAGRTLQSFHDAQMAQYNALPDLDSNQAADVFVSHYPLVRTPVFRNDASQGSYYNMVDTLKAKHYFFGHVHQRDSFNKAGTQFHTHAVGYPGEGFPPSFGYVEV